MNNIKTNIQNSNNINEYINKSKNQTNKDINQIPNPQTNINHYNNLNNQKIETLDIDLEQILSPNKKKYSNTEYSDFDNININKLRCIMVDVQNDLNNKNPEYYKIYCKYLQGLKLSDIIDENGQLKPINKDFFNKSINITNHYKQSGQNPLIGSPIEYYKLQESIYSEINEVILNNKSKINIINQDLLNSTIEEVANTTNGYDAFVIKKQNGNYMIINSCTNDKSIKDIAAIAYPMSKYIFGNQYFLKFILESVLTNEDIQLSTQDFLESLNVDDPNTLTEEYCKECYHGQVKDNINLIKKYANNNNVELYGYSLGGGIQETAYANICKRNPELSKNISSITIYNPFTLFCQIYNSDYIDYLKNDNKLLIYSAEEDFVSTFNDSVKKLKEKTIYIPAKDIEKDSVENILNLGKLITGSAGNHGFYRLDNNAFDTNGNLIKKGEFKNISDTLSYINGTDNIKKIWEDVIGPIPPNYKLKSKTIIRNIFNLSKLESKINTMDPTQQDFANDLIKYIENNFGDYKYNDIANILTNNLWKITKEEINNKKGIEKLFGNIFKDEDVFIDSTYDFLTAPETRELVIDTIGCYLNNNKIDFDINVDTLTNSLENIYKEHIDEDKWFDFLNINDKIKNQYCKKINSTLKNLMPEE